MNQHGLTERKQFPPVPKMYRGAWRRDFIRRANGEFDDTTECWWLQSPTFHIDLRVPANRPPVRNTEEIETLGDEARHHFARQTAWVGVTQVLGSRCQWWSFAAIPKLGQDSDIGLMDFRSDDEVIETCPEGRYQERWLRGSRAERRCVGLHLQADDDPGAKLTAIFLDDMAGLALERSGVLAEVQIAASCDAGGWNVIRASSPWAEGANWPIDIERQLLDRKFEALSPNSGATIKWPVDGVSEWTVLEYSR